MASTAYGPPDSLDFMELSERLESAVPALMSLAARCAIPDSLRSTAWRLFLRVIPPEQPRQWAKVVEEQRAAYESMRMQTMSRLEEAMQQVLPETDEETASPKSFLVQLEDAADQIRGDLERCFPEGAGGYFVETSQQKLMFDVLLVWAHENPTPSYRQGMHELLAPLVWAMALSFETTSLVCLPPGNPLNALRVDMAYLEHDVYWLFAALVDEMLPLYQVSASETRVVAMCGRVQNECLAEADPELHSHLTRFSGHRGKDVVLPQVYMLSWLRLAFVRQFAIADLLKLWDAFFATCRVAADVEAEPFGDFVLVRSSPTDDAKYPSLSDWLEAVATLLIVLERDRLLHATTGSACLSILLRTVAPEPLYVTRHARRLHSNPASLQPLIASLRQHAHLSHIFPAWMISLLSSIGVVTPAPRLSLPTATDSSTMSGNEDDLSANIIGRLLSLVSYLDFVSITHFRLAVRRDTPLWLLKLRQRTHHHPLVDRHALALVFTELHKQSSPK